ncbi:MAG TPA: MBL fold metallo-hydrolase [Dehalococcoidia bacterium]|nr:MBL fold metallo-hydrolase [Dehalococcoidia bacterium]
MKLVNNLYTYVWQGNDNNCNSYLFADVLKGNRHVVIDPGHITTPSYREPGLIKLFKEMEKDGIEGTTGLVILTHAHPDHCEAASMIREQNSALVALHEADGNIYKRSGGIVDIYLEEGELQLANGSQTRLQIYHSPGHSPGHITIYWPEEKVLIAGDVIFYRSTGRVDLPGGNAKTIKQSIERLSGLDINYLLCGHPYGHPGIIEGKEEVQQNFDFIKSHILF